MPTAIPSAVDMQFKEKFIERYGKLTDIGKFKEFSFSYLRKSVRINTLKADVSAIKRRLGEEWRLTPVPWCDLGFWIEHKGEGDDKRWDIGNTVEHLLGYIYVQEAASMIPPLVLDPQPGERVLDMCAAPGSKTTQIAAMMQNTGVIVANDVSAGRLSALGINLQRCGVMNAIVTQMQGFREGVEFDRILVDAPCSGTGTIRKSLKTVETWSPKLASHLCKTQKRLLQHAFSLLKPGGTMVYSTCTLEPEEDEGVVDFLLKKFDDARVEPINLNIKSSPAVTEFEGKKYSEEVKKCLRLWPQDNDTEGFFVAKIKKV